MKRKGLLFVLALAIFSAGAMASCKNGNDSISESNSGGLGDIFGEKDEDEEDEEEIAE